ncbi:HORMA domain-containing protein 2 isoform X5 [Falco rusticolus]|uniref:HORMA domain-containing protein 2 isoform X5 n=1 Tax=Falco rusticolus TaxID=120794 RepID=UPI001886897B|nr:HORMA domain-containing protein 2 isoform X5 [Falco rusticolus]
MVLTVLALSFGLGLSVPGEESVVFPNTIATEQQSMVLVKKLLATSVSCITYMRGLFPERAYATRYLEDLCLKILREDKSCLGSLQIVKWIQGCFDALEKNNQMNFMNGVCSEDVKQASRLLICKLYLLMQNLGPLPNDIILTMKLLYYNDVTPKDYQPPGFKEDDSSGDLFFDGDPVNLSIGSVSTGFHLMKVRVTTEKKRMGTVESNLIQKNGPTEISHQGLDCDEEEEEESTKNHPLSVRADSSKLEEDKRDTHPGWEMEASSFCLQNTGGKKKGIKERGRMPCSRESQQISCMSLAPSQEEVTGPKKKRKVSEPEELLLEGRKSCSF